MKVHEFDAVVGGGEGRLPLVELPFDVKAAYGTARPKVKATVNDVTLRTTVSVYGGRSYVGFRKQIQAAGGIRIGDRVRVRIEPDVEPREIEVPDDLARALNKDPAASQAFAGLSYTHRKEDLEEAVSREEGEPDRPDRAGVVGEGHPDRPCLRLVSVITSPIRVLGRLHVSGVSVQCPAVMSRRPVCPFSVRACDLHGSAVQCPGVDVRCLASVSARSVSCPRCLRR
jgi:hypothetical protein